MAGGGRRGSNNPRGVVLLASRANNDNIDQLVEYSKDPRDAEAKPGLKYAPARIERSAW